MRIFFYRLILIIIVLAGIFYAISAKLFNLASFTDKDKTLTHTQTIEKRPLDNKNYQFAQLENGIKILLIQDKNAKLSAVSLSVGTGSSGEPSSIEGLAHYLEHMLFLGSEKYPKADNFMEFVSQNGGSYNAYTASDETNFFFSIKPVALNEALARFSDFFAAPLLTEEFMQREQEAVHAEYTSKLQDDARRTLDALRQSFNSQNPLSRFSAGNKETLKITPELRPALVKFFNENYISSNMGLVVLTPDSLDATKKLLTKHFVNIKDGDKQELPQVDIFTENFLPAKLEIKSLEDSYKLQLYFPTKNPEKLYRQKPDYYLAHLISYEGEGSILALLKELGWGLSLVAGNSFTYEDSGLFTIQLKLTPEGFNNLSQVKQLIFDYINLIAQEGIEKWRYDELKELFAGHWNYKEGENPLNLVMSLASKLKKVAAKDILKSNYIFSEYDPNLIQEFLQKINARNMLEVVIAPNIATDKQTKWLKTPYKLTSLTRDLLTENKHPLSASRFLPPKNPYLAEQKMLTTKVEAPFEFYTSNNLQIFVGEDASFNTPKIFYRFKFESEIATKSAKMSVVNMLLAKWLKDATEAKTYDAYLADLEAKVLTNKNGLILAIDGLSAKSGELLSLLLEELRYGDISSTKFDILKADLLRNLANKKYRPLTQQIFENFHNEIMPPKFTDASLIENLRKLHLADFEKYRREFLFSSKISAFLYANINKSASEDIKQRLTDFIQVGTSAKTKALTTNILPVGQTFSIDLHIKNPDKGFLYYIQAPDASIENRAKFALLTRLQDAEFFYQLRTLKQLGYVVANINQPLAYVAGTSFLVQAPSTSLEDIYKSVTEFLHKDKERLNNLSAQDFAAFKAGLINLLEKPDDNLTKKASRFWQKIFYKQAPIDDRAEIIVALEALTLKDMHNFYADILAKKYGELIFTAGAEGLRLNKPKFERLNSF